MTQFNQFKRLSDAAIDSGYVHASKVCIAITRATVNELYVRSLCTISYVRATTSGPEFYQHKA